MSKGLKILLVMSLAMNLLVIVAVGTMALRHGHHKHGHWGRGGNLTRALSDEDRQIIAQKMRDARGDRQAAKAAHQQRKAEMLSILRADPFDSTKFTELLEAKQTHTQKRMQLAQTLFLERLTEMSKAERMAYADRLEAQMQRHRKHHKKDHD